MKQLNEYQLTFLIEAAEAVRKAFVGAMGVNTFVLTGKRGGKSQELGEYAATLGTMLSAIDILKAQKGDRVTSSERSLARIKVGEVKVDNWVAFGCPSISCGNVRVYYNTRGKEEWDGNGFDFCAVSSQECVADRFDSETMVEIMFYGNAYFDGVRHLHCGHEDSDNEGYFNYPVMDDVVNAVKVLKDLETAYCRDFQV